MSGTGYRGALHGTTSWCESLDANDRGGGARIAGIEPLSDYSKGHPLIGRQSILEYASGTTGPLNRRTHQPRNPDAMLRTPAISIVLPVRNSERFIGQTMSSVLGQTFGDLELHVVDTGSTDGTLGICWEMARGDDRVRIHENPPSDPVAALNYAISMARGRFFSRLSPEDVSRPTRLQKQIDFLNRYEEVGVLGSCAVLVNSWGEAIGRRDVPQDDAGIREALDRECCLFPSSVVLRRELLEEHGGYRGEGMDGFVEDYDLWMRLRPHTRFANLPDPLVDRRIVGASVCMDHLDRRFLYTLAIQHCQRTQRAGDSLPDMDFFEQLSEEDLPTMGWTLARYTAARRDYKLAHLRYQIPAKSGSNVAAALTADKRDGEFLAVALAWMPWDNPDEMLVSQLAKAGEAFPLSVQLQAGLEWQRACVEFGVGGVWRGLGYALGAFRLAPGLVTREALAKLRQGI